MVLVVTALLFPFLPDIETLRDVQLQVPLKVLTVDGELIAEFGEKKRKPLDYNSFPPMLIKAILAAEDARFFVHPGVDYQGILRAVVSLVRTGERAQGGSTITMQVARNFFLSREKTFLRKFNEILLAFKIESKLSKAEILELYLNKIYLGKRAYGFASASRVYYNLPLAELELHQLAMLAGLPKAPSRYNPVINPERATIRRNYVLGRMLELGFIDEEQQLAQLDKTDNASVYGLSVGVEAPYVAEMVRAEMFERFGKEAYTVGYKVYTTVHSKNQLAANRALRQSLLDYDRRHGYRGVLKNIDLFKTGSTIDVELTELFQNEKDPFERELWDIDWQKELEYTRLGNLEAAIVVQVDEKEIYAYTASNRMAYIPWEKIEWARRYVTDHNLGPELESARQVVTEGDVIMVTDPDTTGCSWLAQVPTVAGSLVSLRPQDGAILALIGGFDYFSSKFNRAMQANRQPGSSFKPFIYSGALDKGFTAASIINDAPVVFDAPGLEDTWRPENYSGKFYGPTRLRKALINSRNLVSIRLLRSVGIGYAVKFARRFGFKRPALPRDLSLALGSGTLTPIELATGYAAFANGGFKVEPYIIDHIVDQDDNILELTNPIQVCVKCVEEEERKQATEEAALAARQEADEKAQLLVQQQTELQEQEEKPEQAPEEQAGQLEEIVVPPEDEVTEAKVETKVAESEKLPLLPLWLSQEGEVIPFHGPIPVKLAPRILSPQTSFIINSMMRDVVRYGTGRRALTLGRKDLAGKTGTTNDQRDAWFSGFNANVVAISWVGFDSPRPLGARETGARAALPMWIDYMRTALYRMEETELKQPQGVVSVRIDEKTGKPVPAGTPGAIFEYFLADQVPESTEKPVAGDQTSPGGAPANITEQLF